MATKWTDLDPIIQGMVRGYGDKFPELETLFNSKATPEEIAVMLSPTSIFGRYLKSTGFLSGVTSGKVVGILRFHVLIEYLIALGDELDRYTGKYSHQKIVHGLTVEDKSKLRQIARTVDDVRRAEIIEAFTEHDTAAAGDYLKLLIGYILRHLSDRIEGVNFGCTSEDNMSIVFGLIGNALFFGYLMRHIAQFGIDLIVHDRSIGGRLGLLVPAWTHQQGAEPNTLEIKHHTHLEAIESLMAGLSSGKPGDKRFTGKMGGGVGNLINHTAAYPDIDWRSFAEKFVESFGLKFERRTDQCVSYANEAEIFRTFATILGQIIKLSKDLVAMGRSPGQMFIKVKTKGTKASSNYPNKTNWWMIEGAIRMLRKVVCLLEFLAEELTDYPDEGDMGRSFLFREIGADLAPAFIALDRISTEIKRSRPNKTKIDAFFREYPGMSGSALQTVLKRARVADDAYRMIEEIAFNPDGSYADSKQFGKSLERKMEELNLPADLREELRSLLDPRNLVKQAQKESRMALMRLKRRFEAHHFRAQKMIDNFNNRLG